MASIKVPAMEAPPGLTLRLVVMLTAAVLTPLLITGAFRYATDNALLVAGASLAISAGCWWVPRYGRAMALGILLATLLWFAFLAWLFNSFEGLENL